MTTLHEITKDHIVLSKMVENEELTISEIADTMDMIEGDFKDKAMSLIFVNDNMKADITAIDAEIKRLQARKKAMNNKRDSMLEYLKVNMEASGITNIKCQLFSITLAEGKDIVRIDDESKIPSDYMDIKTTVRPMKREILAEIKAGNYVEGASIVKSAKYILIR